ncbi:MAG: replication protein DnaC [Tepidanaerobacteraceae bacterium]|nr:replication protein DnaC [Tepidanaerobacteraceae bacterium]
MTESMPTSPSDSCPVCGKKIEYYEFDSFGRHFRIPKPCTCRLEKEDIKAQEFEVKQRRIRIESKLAGSGLGPKFQKCTFESWERSDATDKVYGIVKSYAEKFNKDVKNGIVVYGKCGNGKSHLVAAVVNYLIQKGYVGIFQNVPILLSRLRSAERENESEILHTLTRADILVLDDLGAYKWTGWREEIIYMIINNNYYYEKPILATSNLSPDELAENIGERSMDRLMEMCVFVENPGESYRKKIAVERIKKMRGS